LQSQAGLFVAQARLAFAVFVCVDLALHTHVGEAILLRGQQVHLARGFRDRRLRRVAVFQSPGAKHFHEPLPYHWVRDLDAVEDRQHLLVEFGFGHAVTRVALCLHILAAPKVPVLLPRWLLGDLFTDHDVIAVPASHEAIAVGERVGCLALVAE
jgi:hypothetical protein